MLFISGVQSKEEQERICRACGVPYLADWFCYAGYQDGVLRVACQFCIRGDEGHMHGVYLVPGVQDDEALLLTGRAVLNFLDRCTVKKVFFDNTDPAAEPISRMIGFRTLPDGRRFVDLTGFFTDPCKH